MSAHDSRTGERTHRGLSPLPVGGVRWMDRSPCRRLPCDWWETGDEGNRLAVMICRRACPVRGECKAWDEHPVGMVVAGDAYDESGHLLPLCACGRPVVRRSFHVGVCLTCAAPAPQVLVRRVLDRQRYLARKAARTGVPAGVPAERRNAA